MVEVVWASQDERWHLDLVRNGMGLVTCRLVDSQSAVTYQPIVQQQLDWNVAPHDIELDVYKKVSSLLRKLYESGILYSRVGRLPNLVGII